MQITLFIISNWDSVLVVLGIVALAVILAKKGETKILKEILFRLVTQAEQAYGGGTGELKRAAVIEWLYERIPVVFRVIITKKEVEGLIDEVLAYAKTKWAANSKLAAYIAGK